MTSTTAVKTIEAYVFATHGLPDCEVTDNGPQFIAEEFKSFLIGNGVRHLRAAPYHPATNGLVERFVQTLKRAILVSKEDGRKSGTFALANFLRNTGQLHMQQQGKLLNGRPLKTVIDLVKPNVSTRVIENQSHQKVYHDSSGKIRDLEEGDSVMVKNYREKQNQWIPSIITQKLREVTFMVKLTTGVTRKCHIEQMRHFRGTIPGTLEPETTLDNTTETSVTAEIVPHPKILLPRVKILLPRVKILLLRVKILLPRVKILLPRVKILLP